jgi:N-acetyl-anhydromuramyl-L-alanine amidase AmpD
MPPEDPFVPGPAGEAAGAGASCAAGDPPQGPEYPGASRFVAAAATNYLPWTGCAPRPVERIVLHITDGHRPIAGPIGHFRDPHSEVSAHYIVGQDGEVVQMVRHDDVAWHARSANGTSIGIEHVARSPRELGPDDAGFAVTREQYRSSARLVRWLCERYGLPLDRAHVQGHSEADPGTTHTDCPNRIWDWRSYMALLTAG